MDIIKYISLVIMFFNFLSFNSQLEFQKMVNLILRGNTNLIKSITIPIQEETPKDLSGLFRDNNNENQETKLIMFGKNSNSFIMKTKAGNVLVGDFKNFSGNDIIKKLQENNIEQIHSIFLLNKEINISAYKEILKVIPAKNIYLSKENTNIKYELGMIEKPYDCNIEEMSNNMEVIIGNTKMKFIPNKNYTDFSSIYITNENKKVLLMKDYKDNSEYFNEFKDIDLLIMYTPFKKAEMIQRLNPKKVIFSYEDVSELDKSIVKSITKKIYLLNSLTASITIFSDEINDIKIESINSIQ